MATQTTQDCVLDHLLETLQSLKSREEIVDVATLDGDVRLIGDGAVIDSRSLVELLIGLEDFIEEEYGAKFDWTSDRAMSAKHSPFRTPRTLAAFAVEEASL